MTLNLNLHAFGTASWYGACLCQVIWKYLYAWHSYGPDKESWRPPADFAKLITRFFRWKTWLKKLSWTKNLNRKTMTQPQEKSWAEQKTLSGRRRRRRRRRQGHDNSSRFFKSQAKTNGSLAQIEGKILLTLCYVWILIMSVQKLGHFTQFEKISIFEFIYMNLCQNMSLDI